MSDQLLKAVRITDDMKLEVYQQGKKRKYGIIYDSGNAYINNRRNNTENTKSEKYDVAMSDDDVIDMALKAYNGRFGTPDKKFYITQNPYKDPAPVRTYGAGGTASPYYLNNGCAINIQWIGKMPNPEFNPGTYSNLYQAGKAGKAEGKPRYLENATITATSDDASNSDILPKSSWSVSPPITDGLINPVEVSPDYRDTSYVQNKIVTVTLPNGFTENGGKGYLVWTQGGLQYDSKSIPENTPVQQFSGIDKSGYGGPIGRPKDQITYFSNSNKDSDIIERVISDFTSKVSSLHGIFPYDLKLCAPNNEACSLIPYKSPLEPSNNTANQAALNDVPPGPTQSAPKIKFTIDGLPDVVVIKAKVNLPEFTIWTGPIPKSKELTDQFDELEELDPIYTEGAYAGEEEKIAEVESPSKLSEVPTSANSIQDASSVSSYTPDPNAKPGTIVNLPKDYSHTSQQGYNILNSQWIGDLIASAKSHIGHPTYDISGTDNGNLGCASAVSMMFYRAFGVHMKDGKPVKPKPTDVGSFGTKSTSDAAEFFKNASLYQKINWKDAQPGDIINTARNFSNGKAGHIGVVIDIKAKDGSWAIVSNSSKGFAGGGGGAVKQNYSVNGWQTVTNRNPSETFAFRYIGPRLSSGQTA